MGQPLFLFRVWILLIMVSLWLFVRKLWHFKIVWVQTDFGLWSTILHGSCSYLVQLLAIVRTWTLLIMGSLYLFFFYIFIFASWTRPAEGSRTMDGIFNHAIGVSYIIVSISNSCSHWLIWRWSFLIYTCDCGTPRPTKLKEVYLFHLVRLSVYLCVDRFVSALYLQQYLLHLNYEVFVKWVPNSGCPATSIFPILFLFIPVHHHHHHHHHHIAWSRQNWAQDLTRTSPRNNDEHNRNFGPF